MHRFLVLFSVWTLFITCFVLDNVSANFLYKTMISSDCEVPASLPARNSMIVLADGDLIAVCGYPPSILIRFENATSFDRPSFSSTVIPQPCQVSPLIIPSFYPQDTFIYLLCASQLETNFTLTKYNWLSKTTEVVFSSNKGSYSYCTDPFISSLGLHALCYESGSANPRSVVTMNPLIGWAPTVVYNANSYFHAVIESGGVFLNANGFFSFFAMNSTSDWVSTNVYSLTQTSFLGVFGNDVFTLSMGSGVFRFRNTTAALTSWQPKLVASGSVSNCYLYNTFLMIGQQDVLFACGPQYSSTVGDGIRFVHDVESDSWQPYFQRFVTCPSGSEPSSMVTPSTSVNGDLLVFIACGSSTLAVYRDVGTPSNIQVYGDSMTQLIPSFVYYVNVYSVYFDSLSLSPSFNFTLSFPSGSNASYVTNSSGNGVVVSGQFSPVLTVSEGQTVVVSISFTAPTGEQLQYNVSVTRFSVHMQQSIASSVGTVYSYQNFFMPPPMRARGISVFVIVGGVLYQLSPTTNATAAWTLMNTGLINTAYVDVSLSGEVVAASTTGLQVSTDGGASWVTVSGIECLHPQAVTWFSSINAVATDCHGVAIMLYNYSSSSNVWNNSMVTSLSSATGYGYPVLALPNGQLYSPIQYPSILTAVTGEDSWSILQIDNENCIYTTGVVAISSTLILVSCPGVDGSPDDVSSYWFNSSSAVWSKSSILRQSTFESACVSVSGIALTANGDIIATCSTTNSLIAIIAPELSGSKSGGSVVVLDGNCYQAASVVVTSAGLIVYACSLPDSSPLIGGTIRVLNGTLRTNLTAMTNPSPGVVGDPLFVGFDGVAYEVHGEANKIYSLISAHEFFVNAKFQFIAQRHGSEAHKRESRRKARMLKVVPWSHPGTYLTQIGIGISNVSIVVIAGTIEGGMKIVLNGVRLSQSSPADIEVAIATAKQPCSSSHSSASTIRLQFKSSPTHRLFVSSEWFKLCISNSDRFVNLEQVELSAAFLQFMQSSKPQSNAIHGLLGMSAWRSMANAFRRTKNGVDHVIVGTDPALFEIDDFSLSVNNILGTDFAFNLYDEHCFHHDH